MKNFLVALTLATGGLLALPAAMAADATPAPGRGEAKGACKVDAEKLCAGVKQGEGRIIQCLKEHRKDLSPECKKEIAAARKERKG